MQRHIAYAILIICLLPWFMVQLDTRPPGDASFLLHGAEHMRKGHEMQQHFYDTNPPMSFISYIPATYLKSVIPPYQVITAYTLILIILFTALTYALLRNMNGIQQRTKYALISSFILASTIPVTAEFGQKDHLIALALIPLILAQYKITSTRESSPVTILTLITTTPLILIKPHYGIIPLGMIIHRAYTQKRLTAFLGTDTIILAAGTCLYIAYTYLYMPDFINEILPMSLKLYASTGAEKSMAPIAKTFAFLFFTGMMAGLIWFQDRKKEEKPLIQILAVMAVLAVIPFGLQNKGFSLHLIPAQTLALIGIGLYASAYFNKKYIALFPFIISVLLYTYLYFGFMIDSKIQTHKDFQTSEIAQIIKEHASNSPFFIEDQTTCLHFTLAQYLPNKVASRFPSMWFLHGALTLENNNDKVQILDKFGKYLAQDIKTYTPGVIAFMLNDNNQSPLKVTYDKHTEFKTALNTYTLQQTVEVENIDKCTRGQADTADILKFEIYTRKQ